MGISLEGGDEFTGISPEDEEEYTEISGQEESAEVLRTESKGGCSGEKRRENREETALFKGGAGRRNAGSGAGN